MWSNKQKRKDSLLIVQQRYRFVKMSRAELDDFVAHYGMQTTLEVPFELALQETIRKENDYGYRKKSFGKRA